MPKIVIQLQRQARLLNNLLKQRLNSLPIPSKTAIDQIIKSTYLLIHSAILLVQENASLYYANKKKRQKRTRSNQQIAHEGSLTIAEGLQLAQQLEQPVEENQIVSSKAGESVNQVDLLYRRALPKCSGCRELGYRINRCPKR